MKYKSFISYKHEQTTEFARRLELSLKTYAKQLFKPPLKIFRDENYLMPGIDLPAMILNALAESEFLILLASPGAAESKWVHDELLNWCDTLNRCDRRNKRVHIRSRSGPRVQRSGFKTQTARIIGMVSSSVYKPVSLNSVSRVCQILINIACGTTQL